MSLKTIAGKLLTFGGKLARACECCWKYCCVNVGQPDECGNYAKECQRCPGGPKQNCDEPCPERPPCILQCVEIDQTPCGDPVYDCPVYDTEIIGIPVESCEECPEPPPCDDYYCCYEFEPSQNPESPLPPRNCQIGPCSAPELHSSGPHYTLQSCQESCQDYYCCYDEQPSENPEIPLPGSTCQVGPCDSPELYNSGPHMSLAACQANCECTCDAIYDYTLTYTYGENTGDLGPFCSFVYVRGQQVFTIPAHIPLPVKVVLTGSVNDDLVLNGQVIQEGLFPFGGNPCNGAHEVNYCFTATSRTFTLATKDNYGFGLSADITIRFCRPCGVRSAPTVTVSGTSGSGTGATFGVTLAQSQDLQGRAVWAVSEVTRTGGSGYQTGDTLTFAIADGDAQGVAAAATIAGPTYTEPTLSLSVAGGAGAVLQINGYTKVSAAWGPVFADTWRISGITVANGGSGYTDNTPVTVILGPGDETRTGAVSDLRARTGFRAPVDDWSLEDGAVPQTGDGLVLSLTMELMPGTTDLWWVVSWAVIDGGSGYGVGQRIRPYAIEGNDYPTPLPANLEITAVGSGGAVTAIDLVGANFNSRNTSRGRYAVDVGVITSIANLSFQAGWRKAVGDGVLVTNGGHYYRCEENPFP